jgi:hypothetical protein
MRSSYFVISLSRIGLILLLVVVVVIIEILYDLEIYVKDSTIPHGGCGTFFKYCGARRLSKEAARRGELEMTKYKPRIQVKTDKPLQSISSTGYGETVKLTGTSLLHCRGDYVLKRKDVELLEPVPNGIGFLRIHRESDYSPARSLVFDSTLHHLELGIYGPLQKKDRVLETIYTIKNCVFGNAPSEYGFDVREKLYKSNLPGVEWDSAGGEDQVIDITDVFGQPHELAKAKVYM